MSGSQYAHNILVQPSAILQAICCSFTDSGVPKNLALLRSGLLEVYSIEGEGRDTGLKLIISYQLPPCIRRISHHLDTQTHHDLIIVSSETELIVLDCDTILNKIFIRNRHKLAFPGRIQLLESPDKKFVICWSSVGIVGLFSLCSAVDSTSCTILRGLPAIHELVDVSITASTDVETLADFGLSPATFFFAILWADSAHDIYTQIFALPDPSTSQASMLKEITKKIPIQSQCCFIRPFGRGKFIVIGPSSLFIVSTRTIDSSPILHPCTSPTSLSNVYMLSKESPKSLFLHDKSGLLIEILITDDSKKSISQQSPPVMRYWGLVSSSIYSLLIRSDVLFLCSYSGPSLLLYVDWNKCRHFSFSLKDTIGVSDNLALDNRSIDREDTSTEYRAQQDDSTRAGHQTESIETRTFQHLSLDLLAKNSQLQCSTPLILAQIVHKGPIVDICYIPLRTTGLFEYTYLRLETPLFSCDWSSNKDMDSFSRLPTSTSGQFNDGVRKKRAQFSFPLCSSHSSGQFNSLLNADSINNLDDLIQWAFQQTKYSKVAKSNSNAYNIVPDSQDSTEAAICTISGSGYAGSINFYQRKLSHKFRTLIHLPGVLSISKLSSSMLLLRIYNREYQKFGSIVLHYWYDNEFKFRLIKQLQLPLDLYNFESYPIHPYGDTYEDKCTNSAALILTHSMSSLSVIELDTNSDKFLSTIYSTTIKDLLSSSPLSCFTTEEASTFSQLPSTYFDTVTITSLAVSPNGRNIAIALSNGSIITSRFTSKNRVLEVIKCRRFSISDAFLPHNNQVTFTIYSIAVSDEGCVSVCCLGIPYIFLLDMNLQHILNHSSDCILYLPPRNAHSSSTPHINRSGTDETVKCSLDDNTLSSILSGSPVQSVDDISLLVQLNQGGLCSTMTEAKSSDTRLALCPYSHSSALKLSTPSVLNFVGPSCLIMLSLEGTVHVYTIGKVCVGKDIYFICDKMYTHKFSTGEVIYLSVIKRAELLSDEHHRSDAEVYLSSASKSAVMHISLSKQINVPCEPNPIRNDLSFVSTKLGLQISIYSCVDKFSAILPLTQTGTIQSYNKPSDRAPLGERQNGQRFQRYNLYTQQPRIYISYNLDTQILSLAHRASSTIICSSATLPGLPRRLAHISYHGMLCVGFHSPRPLSSNEKSKHSEFTKTSSVINLNVDQIDEVVPETNTTTFQENAVEHYSYNNITRTFDMLTTKCPKHPTSLGSTGTTCATSTTDSIPEALVTQNSYSALRFFSYNLHPIFTAHLPNNAIISGLQYIPLRDDKLPFIVVGYNLPSTEQADAEDGVIEIYDIKTSYSPKKEHTLELIASFLFSGNTVCDIAPYTNHRIAVSLRTAAVILALVTEKDLAKDDITRDTSGLHFGHSLGKPFMSTEYQLLEVYNCTGPALLLKIGTAYSQMTLLDMLKGITLMSDGLGTTRTVLEQPRLVIQSQLLQRIIPSCVYQMGIDGPILIGDRTGYIHIIKLHNAHGLTVIASHYVGEQIVCFSPAPGRRRECTVVMDKGNTSTQQLIESYPPILYATIGGQIGIITKITHQCSTMFCLVENAMRQKSQICREPDALIDLCTLEKYETLSDDEKRLIVANLLSAKYDGLTTDVLVETIAKVIRFSVPW